jgi:tripartite-type tricarboxylate transporter receptor subunit TctC
MFTPPKSFSFERSMLIEKVEPRGVHLARSSRRFRIEQKCTSRAGARRLITIIISTQIPSEKPSVKAISVLFVAAVLLPAGTAAQNRDFPQRPIRIIVPVPPGGSVDATARLLAPKMSESLGQSVVIDNRGGASTNIGMEMVARAPADGYTLLANTAPLVANPALFPKLAFSPEKDFSPLSLVVTGPSVVVAHPSVPVRTLAELIALAKAKPGTINYSSSGAGTLTHLGAELFKYLSGTNIVHVPYKGGGPALAAVVGGEIDVTFQTPLAAAGQIKAGRLKALAITAGKRLAILPEVPTAAESGMPKFEFQSWVGLLAPANTPPAIVRQLNEHIVRAARAPDITERFTREGAEVVAGTPEHFRKVIADETALWGKVIREMGIKAE